jgi:hypothetical protein
MQPLEIPMEYAEVVRQFCNNHTGLLENIVHSADDHTHRCVVRDAAIPCESCKCSEHPVVKEPVEVGVHYPQ